jgi:hypothetical protein
MNKEPTQLQIALGAADAGNAGHWPTVAGILADEYRAIAAKLAAATEQRDRLMEALERIDYCLSNAENVMHGAGSDDITIARRIIMEAFAAVKGGSDIGELEHREDVF